MDNPTLNFKVNFFGIIQILLELFEFDRIITILIRIYIYEYFNITGGNQTYK